MNLTNVQEENSNDYTHFFEECAKHRSECKFLNDLIDEETQKKFNVGFCPTWVNTKAIRNGEKTIPRPKPKIIIPASSNSYFAINVGYVDVNSEEEVTYIANRKNSNELFNMEILKVSTEPVFVVDDAVDVISFAAVGHNAVALADKDNCHSFVGYVKNNVPKYPLIFTTNKLYLSQFDVMNELDKLNIYYMDAHMGTAINYESFYEALFDNKEGLKEEVEMYINGLKEYWDSINPN